MTASPEHQAALTELAEELHTLHLVQQNLTGSYDTTDPISLISMKVHDTLAKPIENEIYELLRDMYIAEIYKRKEREEQ